MDTCRVSAHQSASHLGGGKAWEEGARRPPPGTGLGGLAGRERMGLGPWGWLCG